MKQAVSKVAMALEALMDVLVGEPVSVCLGQSLIAPVAGCYPAQDPLQGVFWEIASLGWHGSQFLICVSPKPSICTDELGKTLKNPSSKE